MVSCRATWFALTPTLIDSPLPIRASRNCAGVGSSVRVAMRTDDVAATLPAAGESRSSRARHLWVAHSTDATKAVKAGQPKTPVQTVGPGRASSTWASRCEWMLRQHIIGEMTELRVVVSG